MDSRTSSLERYAIEFARHCMVKIRSKAVHCRISYMQFCFISVHSITNSFQSAFKLSSMQSA